MEIEKLSKIIKNAGAQYVSNAIIIADVVILPEIREICEKNKCGCYDTSWGCPPGCGDLPKLKRKLKTYNMGLVFQNNKELEDPFDVEGMYNAAKNFQTIIYHIKKELYSLKEDSLVLGAGTCMYCDECTYPDQPCIYPQYKTISVEAYGIDVAKLCEQAGLEYRYDRKLVTNTGLVAIKK